MRKQMSTRANVYNGRGGLEDDFRGWALLAEWRVVASFLGDSLLRVTDALFG
eukprot:CAMPEP_0117446444 /NCGR_PEP_ID=MMETSP0759-20121206/6344_1 /TAXON_ID=63605 /ORGANISM="Percolomonas cosmopolitus, Strain WS" /LENGTH=51 /DNA_ID=CAMNT_0005238711 /DNA_START=945 /DNA_END=1100 /DNA_ORIENTATION=+